MINVTAPGKLILIGEYVVLEGAPALVCAVDRFARVTIHESSEADFTVDAPSIGIKDTHFSISENNLISFLPAVDLETQKKLTFFKNTFEYAWQYCQNYKITKTALKIIIDTDAFYSQKLSVKLGFGSSAALTVALVKALFKLVNKNLKMEKC